MEERGWDVGESVVKTVGVIMVLGAWREDGGGDHFIDSMGT